MKKFRDLDSKQLDTMESIFKLYQGNINKMIDLLDLEPDAFKKVFQTIFEDNIKNRKKYFEKCNN